MNSGQDNHASMPFWDFLQSLDPNAGTGRGVDHNGPQFPNMANFPGGFPFGGPGHHGGPHGPHHGPPHGPPHGPAGPPPPGPSDAHGAGFEWGPAAAWFNGPAGPWAHYDRRGPHHHRGWSRHGMNPNESREDETRASASDVEPLGDKEKGKNDSPDTLRDDAPDPAEVAPEDDGHDRPPHHRGCGRGRGGRGRRGACRGGRGGFRWGGSDQMPGTFPGGHPPPPYAGQGAPFDLGGFLRNCTSHPFFQNLRDQATSRFQPPTTTTTTDPDSFTPPVDVFSTERAFVLHVSLPGAKKEDIGINWDGDAGVLNIAGVVHRPGDEEFLSTLASTERKVGMFERNVTLPPAGSAERDEVDGYAITAKMEDGILIVTVPKVEKEWTEIHKIDIE